MPGPPVQFGPIRSGIRFFCLDFLFRRFQTFIQAFFDIIQSVFCCMPCSNGQIGIHFMNHSMISTPDRDPFGEANFELFDFNENKHYPRHDSI